MSPAQLELDQIDELKRSFDSILASELEPHVSAGFEQRYGATHSEKKAAANWVNETTAEYGLSPLCPSANSPAKLYAIRSHADDGGRIYFRPYGKASVLGSAGKIEPPFEFKLVANSEKQKHSKNRTP